MGDWIFSDPSLTRLLIPLEAHFTNRVPIRKHILRGRKMWGEIHMGLPSRIVGAIVISRFHPLSNDFLPAIPLASANSRTHGESNKTRSRSHSRETLAKKERVAISSICRRATMDSKRPRSVITPLHSASTRLCLSSESYLRDVILRHLLLPRTSLLLSSSLLSFLVSL